MPFFPDYLCRGGPHCDYGDLIECIRNPGSAACGRLRDCLSIWIDIRWLCRVLPGLIPPLPLPGPDPVPFPGGGDPQPWPISGKGGGLQAALEAELLLEALAPKVGEHESALPSIVGFIRKEGLVPEGARRLAERLRETADLLEKETKLMEKDA